MLNWIFTKVAQLCIISIVILISPLIFYAMLESEYYHMKGK